MKVLWVMLAVYGFIAAICVMFVALAVLWGTFSSQLWWMLWMFVVIVAADVFLWALSVFFVSKAEAA